jgi:phosphohistidine phosphatase SixA
MIINKVPHIILSLVFFLFFFNIQANEIDWKHTQEGNKILLIRHALAPGGGDPAGFKINNCKTQRNLNQTGINQSKKIGELFKKNNVPVDQVLSSQWCRCKDTAKYAFKKFKEFSALNSTFQSPYDKNEPRQLKEIKNFVKKWDGKGKNLILITHYSIITAITNAVPGSGEIVVTDKNFNVLTTISTN